MAELSIQVRLSISEFDLDVMMEGLLPDYAPTSTEWDVNTSLNAYNKSYDVEWSGTRRIKIEEIWHEYLSEHEPFAGMVDSNNWTLHTIEVLSGEIVIEATYIDDDWAP